jgi:nucleoside-diphosphate-sugar epimerase
MKVIVLGGTGWVGHKIALQFAAQGHDVTICTRGRKSEFADKVAFLNSIKADKSNETDAKKIFETRYDIVVDSVPTTESMEFIHKYARGLKQYIHCSSTGGYTPLPFIPCDETAPYGGFKSGSGWAFKAKYDTMALDLFLKQGFPATIIRPCYITGPGMDPLDNLGGRRPDFISDVMNRATLDLPNDGLALLQPIHVDDLAHSFLLAAETRRSIGQIYNICLEKAVTLNRYLEITAAAFNMEVVINHLPVDAMLKKYGQTIDKTGLLFLANHMCFDISKARDQLGFKPTHTTEEAIEENALWTAENYR